jgi:adenine-specific DNA-methyltransferase
MLSISCSIMKKDLGQYFTTHISLLSKVREFVKNDKGVILEPSCGAGHIIEFLKNNGESRDVQCIEIDNTIHCIESVYNDPSVNIIHADFLEHKFDNTFSTIVGNPPYVKRKSKANLYVEFIYKCIDLLDETGELVFIIPSDFLKLTSASGVKNKMKNLGSITHIYHPHNEQLFKEAAQDVFIIRFQKGIYQNTILYNDEQRYIKYENGNVYIQNEMLDDTVSISSIFDVKVGMVSGADKVFKNNELGNITLKTFNGNAKYLYVTDLDSDDVIKTHLEKHKTELKDRRIRKFNDDNWFEWGCPRNMSFMESNKERECLYCATITRKRPIFFKDGVTYFDGSLLCLLPKQDIDFEKILEYLNSDVFLDNFKYAGRYKIGQKALSDCQIPKSLIAT